jgi:hypothetical protein
MSKLNSLPRNGKQTISYRFDGQNNLHNVDAEWFHNNFVERLEYRESDLEFEDGHYEVKENHDLMLDGFTHFRNGRLIEAVTCRVVN